MTIRTNRRTFLQGAGIAVAASALTFRPGRARAATTLTLGHGAAPGNPRTVAAEAFAKMVAERTNGEVAINIAGSEQLGNDVSMLTSMRTGALDLTANSQGAASGLVPGDRRPRPAVHLQGRGAGRTRCSKARSARRWSRSSPRVGLIPLDWWDNGIRHTTNAKKSIETPADFSGMKHPHPRGPGDRRHLPGARRGDPADPVRRALHRAAAGRGRRPGEPARQHRQRQALRGEQVHHPDRPPVAVDAVPDVAVRPGEGHARAARDHQGGGEGGRRPAAQADGRGRREAARRVQGEPGRGGERARPRALPGGDGRRHREVQGRVLRRLRDRGSRRRRSGRDDGRGSHRPPGRRWRSAPSPPRTGSTGWSPASAASSCW